MYKKNEANMSGTHQKINPIGHGISETISSKSLQTEIRLMLRKTGSAIECPQSKNHQKNPNNGFDLFLVIGKLSKIKIKTHCN